MTDQIPQINVYKLNAVLKQWYALQTELFVSVTKDAFKKENKK